MKKAFWGSFVAALLLGSTQTGLAQDSACMAEGSVRPLAQSIGDGTERGLTGEVLSYAFTWRGEICDGAEYVSLADSIFEVAGVLAAEEGLQGVYIQITPYEDRNDRRRRGTRPPNYLVQASYALQGDGSWTRVSPEAPASTWGAYSDGAEILAVVE